jgi:hypothetical protein
MLADAIPLAPPTNQPNADGYRLPVDWKCIGQVDPWIIGAPNVEAAQIPPEKLGMLKSEFPPTMGQSCGTRIAHSEGRIEVTN